MTMGMARRAAQLSTTFVFCDQCCLWETLERQNLLFWQRFGGELMTLVPSVPIIISGIVSPDDSKTQLDKDMDYVEVFA
jgi:hypothetical protein